MSHLRYLSYVLRHKWFVFVAGLKTGAPLWRLLVHDWSKFTPAEWGPYVRMFYGTPIVPDGVTVGFGGAEILKAERQAAFDVAWLHHQHHNPHHWQSWVLREDRGGEKVLRMPEHFVREMVADWMGAGRAIAGRWEVAEWYAKNRDIIQLHPESRRLVDALVALNA